MAWPGTHASDEHVPAVAAGVSEHPGVAPRLAGPQRVLELFVPAGIALADGDVVVPLVRVADVTRGLEEVQVIGATVVGEPEIPYPGVC